MKTDAQRLAAKQDSALDLGGLGDLAAMLDTPVAPSGQPVLFDIDLIDEDPNNQRSAENPGFSEESINELAASMMEGRGVKSPISLRPNPEQPGRFFINHGHRRVRAAKVANLTQVPGFIDAEFSQYDQMIENIQRENLTAREIADFVGSEVAKGKTTAQIAAALGKSKAFVSQHTTLLNLPDPIADAFHSGAIQDVTLLNELARAYKENPDGVKQMLQEAQTGDGLAAKQLTRKAVKELRKKKEEKPKDANPIKPQNETRNEPATALKTIEKALALDWQARVKLNENDAGQIIMTIHADSRERFWELLELMGQSDLADNV